MNTASDKYLQKRKKLLRKPPWMKVTLPGGENYLNILKLKNSNSLKTVCEEASCPNIGECWSNNHATFMLFGKDCTRACRFCDVDTLKKPQLPDPHEPVKVALSCKAMGVKYCVITSVNRDDLPDGGASLFAATVQEVRFRNPEAKIELLIPDFKAREEDLKTVIDASPHVVGHNLETSRALHRSIRPQSDYDQSLRVLNFIKRHNPEVFSKSAFMVGLGETDEDVREMLHDLADQHVDIVHIGQYAQPSLRHATVDRYVTPEQFDLFAEWGKNMGIKAVMSGPLVRSSYKAWETYLKLSHP